ncbi:uncharacterized protein [Palaemon carinicauda]|uniref:uncharacterized protein isoform X1 n=1 Tax=Palaemon carinicauda TaxID=392227 RepID=UPI0035B63FD0
MNSGGHVEKEMEEQRENNELQQFMDDVKILRKMGFSRHPRFVSSSFQSNRSLGATSWSPQDQRKMLLSLITDLVEDGHLTAPQTCVQQFPVSSEPWASSWPPRHQRKMQSFV